MDIYGMTIPSRKVGGYAYLWHQRRNGEIVLMIADVMGKGLPSALLMSQIQAILMIFAGQHSSPSAIVSETNEFIYRYSTQEKFISMFVAVIDPQKDEFHFCNAGHNPPFILRRDGTHAFLEEGGMPVGVFPDQHYMEGAA